MVAMHGHSVRDKTRAEEAEMRAFKPLAAFTRLGIKNTEVHEVCTVDNTW
jgi:hypothetical protein